MATSKKRAVAMERLRQYRRHNADVAAARAEYLNEQRMNQFKVGDAYEVEGLHKVTTDRRSEVA